MRRATALVISCVVWLSVTSLPALAQAPSPAPSGGGAAEGPPWTYQMARLGIFLLVLTAIMIALAYRRFVVIPQRRLREERRRQRGHAAPEGSSRAP